jgi:hypothetical protein
MIIWPVGARDLPAILILGRSLWEFFERHVLHKEQGLLLGRSPNLFRWLFPLGRSLLAFQALGFW